MVKICTSVVPYPTLHCTALHFKSVTWLIFLLPLPSSPLLIYGQVRRVLCAGLAHWRILHLRAYQKRVWLRVRLFFVLYNSVAMRTH